MNKNLSDRLERWLDPMICNVNDELRADISEAAELARRVEGAAKVKVRGKVGEVCTVAISHDYCGQRVAIVPVEGGA